MTEYTDSALRLETVPGLGFEGFASCDLFVIVAKTLCVYVFVVLFLFHIYFFVNY